MSTTRTRMEPPTWILRLVFCIVTQTDYYCTSVLYNFKPFNPLTPRSDQHVTSPDNLQTLSSEQVMRILKLIR